MKKRIGIYSAVVVACAALCAFLLTAQMPGMLGSTAQNILITGYGYIVNAFVNEISKQEIDRGAVTGLANSLGDPASGFLPGTSAWYLDKTANVYGVDAVIAYKNNVPYFVSVGAGGPACRAGALPGDFIHYIGETNMGYISGVHAESMLSAPQQTSFTMTIFRPVVQSRWDIPCERSQASGGYLLETVIHDDAKYLYIRPHHLTRETADTIANEIQGRAYKDARGIILDLRNVIAGDYDAAVHFADYFLPRGEIIALASGRIPDGNKKLVSYLEPVYAEKPMAVIVDAGTSQGAEIIAGALQKRDRTVLTGTVTAGLCSITRTYPMNPTISYQDVMVMTVGRYMTPDEEVIHGTGVTPQTIVTNYENNPEYAAALNQVLKNEDAAAWAAENSTLTESAARNFYSVYKEKNDDAPESFEVFLRALQLLKNRETTAVPIVSADSQFKSALQLIKEL